MTSWSWCCSIAVPSTSRSCAQLGELQAGVGEDLLSVLDTVERRLAGNRSDGSAATGVEGPRRILTNHSGAIS